MSNLVTVTRHENVALIALNNPPVNALSHAVRSALLPALEELFAAPDVSAIVIVCEGRTFIAGADIREFGKPPLAPDLPELVELLDGAPKASIAVIHGTALGGGLELALACHFRIAVSSAKLGLPEVTLGILPGAGGTQRLPRLIGVRAALDMIVSGTPISAAQAQRLGLIDEVVAEDVKEAGLAFARRVLAEGRPLRRVSALSAKLDDPALLGEYQRGIAERCRGFLAPFRCIEAVAAAVELPFADGLQRERELFRELMASPESKAQRHLFFGEREVAKVPGLAEDTSARPIKSVAIAGADPAFTSALARCFSDARIAVTLLARDSSELERCVAAIQQGYAAAIARGSIRQEDADARLKLLRPSLSFDDARSADLLIEAAEEELDAKRALLAQLDSVAKPNALLATTSAFLELDSLAAATSRPADVVGMHFARPVERVKLLENVRGRLTAADAYATVMKLGRSLGKLAVPVRAPVASRLLAQRSREALLLLDEGALPEALEQALLEFGFAPGSFSAQELLRLRATLLEGAAPSASNLARLGGYTKPRGASKRSIPAQEINERCLLSIVNEAARALDEGVIARPLDVDMIWVHGYGFPVYRGGPLFFADQLGLAHVYQRIQHYREQVGDEHWTPAPLIERLAASGGSFYAPR